jgi:uncharacterized protein (UPF0332 family)
VKRNLIKRARSGLTGTKRPLSAYLRRSVSDAYYALFHALAEMLADALIGASKRNTDSWRHVYRGLNHGHAKAELGTTKADYLHTSVKRIGKIFSQLQEARHSADYDPRTILTRRADAEAFVILAETAIADIDALPADVRRDLAVLLLVKTRV